MRRSLSKPAPRQISDRPFQSRGSVLSPTRPKQSTTVPQTPHGIHVAALASGSGEGSGGGRRGDGRRGRRLPLHGSALEIDRHAVVVQEPQNELLWFGFLACQS